MKKSNALAALLIVLFCGGAVFAQAQVTDPKTTAGQSASDHVNNNVSSGINNSLDKTENTIKGLFKKKKPAKADSTKSTANDAGGGAYSNYDFVPGDQIIFDDNFIDDADGEFPAHWSLEKGQAIINKIGGIPAFCLTEGNYVQVAPRLKTPDNYLQDNFTVEFDFFPTDGSYSPGILFGNGSEGSGEIFFGKDVSTSYFDKDFSGTFPGDLDHFNGKWHHAAMIRKGTQIKCYIDQYRVLVVPDASKTKMTRLLVGGIGSMEHPIVFRNFRIAAGGSMNMIGKKFTDNKIVTHGINFDVDKATLKPESMGTLNMIVGVMRDNPDVKFEIDGHTDNSGAAVHNLDLSQQRADAVRTQLVGMGIDASRLTTKGFGDSKPISDNMTPEGKANNRRVEFIKM
jgi:OOP family OmpA-OmpF porin